MNGTKKRSAIMHGKLFDFHLYYELNEAGRREYTVVGNFSFERGSVRVGEVSKVNSSTDDTVEVLFHVYVDRNSNRGVISFAEELGELGIDEQDGIIERYLVVHPEGRTEPDKKPKGKVFTGSAKPRI